MGAGQGQEGEGRQKVDSGAMCGSWGHLLESIQKNRGEVCDENPGESQAVSGRDTAAAKGVTPHRTSCVITTFMLWVRTSSSIANARARPYSAISFLDSSSHSPPTSRIRADRHTRVALLHNPP